MVAKLRAAGVELEELAPADWLRACSAFQDDVLNLQLTYPRSNTELLAAIAGADIRTVGEGWVFSAKASTVDITPLEAVVIAAYAARGVASTPKVFAY